MLTDFLVSSRSVPLYRLLLSRNEREISSGARTIEEKKRKRKRRASRTAQNKPGIQVSAPSKIIEGLRDVPNYLSLPHYFRARSLIKLPFIDNPEAKRDNRSFDYAIAKGRTTWKRKMFHVVAVEGNEPGEAEKLI